MEVFAARGSANMSLRSIAAELEIEHSTIRHYFPSLEALLLAVVSEREGRANDSLLGRDGLTLWDQFDESARINSGIPGLIALYTSMLATSVEPENVRSKEYFSRRFHDARKAIASSIEEGRKTGATPSGPDANALAALLLAAFDGLQVQWLLDPDVHLPETLAILAPLIGDAPATSLRSEPQGSSGSD